MKKKDLSLLIAKAIPRTGSLYDKQSILSIFGYSPSTNVEDTRLYRFGLVKNAKSDFIITGFITKCWGRNNLKTLSKLPKRQRAYISDEVIQHVRQQIRNDGIVL